MIHVSHNPIPQHTFMNLNTDHRSTMRQYSQAAHRMALLESRISAPGSTPTGPNAMVISTEGGFSERSNSLSNPFANMQHANPTPPPR
jgi:hypothetical protein